MRRKLDGTDLAGLCESVRGRLHDREELFLLVNAVSALKTEQHTVVIDLDGVLRDVDLLEHRLKLVEEFVARELFAEILKLERHTLPFRAKRKIIREDRLVNE